AANELSESVDKDDVIPPKVAASGCRGCQCSSRPAQRPENSRALSSHRHRRQRMCTSRGCWPLLNSCRRPGQRSDGLIYLSRQHYLDAVTERNFDQLLRLPPLCPEPLSPTSGQSATAALPDHCCYCSDACFAQSAYVHDKLIPETPLWLRVGADASASCVDPPPLTADALTETLAAVEPRPGDPVVLDAVAEDLDRLLKISDKPQASEVKEAPKLSTETPAQRPSLAWLDRLVQSTSTATDSAPFCDVHSEYAGRSGDCSVRHRASIEKRNAPPGEQRRMPPVDSASQATLRRRVVQEKLAAFVGAAAVKLDGLNCIADDLRQLVDHAF
uniref:RTR1-type domain-containing protein n=1 Tax=Macrostomum lignano TaxID=282301 RepID=A0A1I8FGW3_9PLAT